jgi:hypothetical protein
MALLINAAFIVAASSDAALIDAAWVAEAGAVIVMATTFPDDLETPVRAAAEPDDSYTADR